MRLHCEVDNLEEYLIETDEVDIGHLVIKEKASELFNKTMSEIEVIKTAFEFVRDDIAHSWDIQSSRITRKASEVLVFKEGICYAKSNLLVALLRTVKIPTGFCYQRITLGDTPDTGYCIHALNAVYLSGFKRWIRIDARGNKEGIDSQFSVDEEKLAFPIRQHYSEVDYPIIYKNPNPKTIETLINSKDCIEMYLRQLPTEI